MVTRPSEEVTILEHSTLEALFRRAQHASLCFSPCLNRQASLCLTPCLNEQPSSPTLSPLLVLSPRFAPPGVITVALGTGGLEGILAIWTLGASPRPKVTGTLGTRGPWQFGRTGTANRIKILCQCTLGSAGTAGHSMTVRTSHASRRGGCTQWIGMHAWLVRTVVEWGVGACCRASSAVRAVPRNP